MDTSVLGTVAAEQMKAIEDSMDEGEVQIVCSVVGIAMPNGEQAIRLRANCHPTVQLQILAAAQQAAAALLAQGQQPGS